MKVVIEIINQRNDRAREFVLVDKVADDDQLWQVMDKLRESSPVRLVWAGLSPREYTASEILEGREPR